MEILQFCLLASDVVMRGRTPFFAINSNRFGKPWEYEWVVGKDERGNEIKRKRIENGPSRKIFGTYLNELLKEKLLIRIITNDKRSKYYSITPLGIIHLIKSELFSEETKYPWPERYYAMTTLISFATPRVKPYQSIIFEGQKFDFTDLYDDLSNMSSMHIRGLMALFPSKMDFHGKLDFTFYMDINSERSSKIELADFNIGREGIGIKELGKRIKALAYPSYEPLILDDEQFHHYFANLLICTFLYEHAVFYFDYYQDHTRSDIARAKKDRRKADLDVNNENIDELINEYKDKYKKILILFNNKIASKVNHQAQILNKFTEKLTKISV